MNNSCTQEITDIELFTVVTSMVVKKIPKHDGIPLEFVQQLWPTIGFDFHHMILLALKKELFKIRLTKCLNSLISKEGDTKYLN